MSQEEPSFDNEALDKILNETDPLKKAGTFYASSLFLMFALGGLVVAIFTISINTIFQAISWALLSLGTTATFVYTVHRFKKNLDSALGVMESSKEQGSRRL